MASTSEIIGNRIRALRSAKGWTLEILAERAGVRFETVSRVERGVQEPTLGTLDKLCSTLGVSVRDLLPEDEGSRPSAAEVAEVMAKLNGMTITQFNLAREIITVLAR